MQNIESPGFGLYFSRGTSIFGLVYVDDITSLVMLVYYKILGTAGNYKPGDEYCYWFGLPVAADQTRNILQRNYFA